MIRRALESCTVVLSTVLLSSCVSALGEVPDVADLAGAPAASGRDAADLERTASALLEGSLDRDELDQARTLFLEAAALDRGCLDCLLGASRATALLIEREDDAARRKDLATEGVRIGQACSEAFPDEPECRYRLALAVGQQARERPSTGVDGLDVMIGLLETLIAEAPDIDRGGPDRVLALVLLRAPGWPTGPGDPEAALDHARSAVARFPEYPPNRAVLAEALADNERPDEARRAWERVVEQATAFEAAGDPEAPQWRREAERALDVLRR